VKIANVDRVEGIIARPPVVTPTIEDAYKTSVLITPAWIVPEDRELVKMLCVEMLGGMTLFVINDATVDVSWSVFTEFPPVMLDTDKYFVKTFCVES